MTARKSADVVQLRPRKRAAPKPSEPKNKATRGERVIEFIETYCKVPSGDLVGRQMKLEPFQRKFILDVYDNPYGTRRAYLSMARKNGKTALIAALALAHVVGPERLKNSQVVSGAMSRDQAALVFELAAMMIAQDDRLQAVARVVPTYKKIFGIVSNVEYQALAAEAKTKHGLSPSVAILDEIGQVEGPTDKFVSAITTSQGAYEHPLLFAISTQSSTDADLFSLWLDAAERSKDPRIVCHLYAAPKDCKLDDRTAWAAANPALGKFKALRELEDESRLAIDMPANEAEFRQYSLNQRVTSNSPFVSKAVWDSNGAAPTPIDGRKIYGGLDLASVNDLCAFVTVDDDDGSINSYFWLPEHGLREKSEQDRVPYDLWKKQGHLFTTPGRAVQYKHMAEFLRGVFDRADVIAIGFDRYLMEHLKPWLVEVGFSERELERFKSFGQGHKSMTPALRELEVRLLNSELRHGNHPVLTMCMANATIEGDSGARKFVKPRDSKRIDGAVALAEAIGVMPSEAGASEPEYQILVLGERPEPRRREAP